ncbi:hypothetical protein LB566_15585 [Mesorhizobium sp. CA13]|uniref:hypothetical protein n=1 Tax=unclassified Mesorhizobium TaxID=325217 RepID=UPI001CCB9CFE|nr:MULTISPECIES: hypothetical protein [unclassified Mesorhizobium]MBZ9855230.1 hypothetical protein [Mesorhizobium sp. CA13]MBZ9966304.1 hypothetical protein [Mesorhizobium sp. BR1-1-2]
MAVISAGSCAITSAHCTALINYITQIQFEFGTDLGLPSADGGYRDAIAHCIGTFLSPAFNPPRTASPSMG